MSKKALKKVASAFTFGASDMILKQEDPMAKEAKRAAQAQEQQARQQAQQAAEAAAQAQRQIQSDSERQMLQQQAAEQQQVVADAPTVSLAPEEAPSIQSKRNRFRSIGGKGGASVRV